MSRKHQAEKREYLKDPIYQSKLVTRLINKIMLDGKKGTAQRILYSAFQIIEEKTKTNPSDVFAAAFTNIAPAMETTTKRVGGSNIPVPKETTESRKSSLALRWIVQYARLRKEKSMEEKLANEIIDASNGVGGAVKKREDVIKQAEANRVYANVRG
jgi:small subunit ribosomal protein S7